MIEVSTTQRQKTDVVIVGGSLVGLTCALALSRVGVTSRVFERTSAHLRVGGGLGVDRAQLYRVTGKDPRVAGIVPMLPVVQSYRESTSWLALHTWLREHVVRDSAITLEEGMKVEDVLAAEDAASVVLADGSFATGQLMLGCDGYRSRVRRYVNPLAPGAHYAGYMLWRGMVSEREMPSRFRFEKDSEKFVYFERSGYRLIAYLVPGADGSTRARERQVSFAWYDGHRTELLKQQGCVDDDGNVVGTLGSSRIPERVRQELHAANRRVWPEPWKSFIEVAVSGPVLYGTPICEYKPQSVVRKRAAILGDAAHVASPMTGRGFLTGVEDIASLAALFSRERRNKTALGETVLEEYAATRLEAAQALVRDSQLTSREFLSLSAKGVQTRDPKEA